MVEWKSEWVAFRDKQSIWPMCGFMLFVWSCRDKIKADMLLGWRRTRILLCSCPLKSCLGIFSWLLSSSPFIVSFLCISFYRLLSHPHVLTPLLVSHLLSFDLLSIPPPHPSQFLISPFNSSTCPSSHLLLTFSFPLLTSPYILATFGHILPLIYFILTSSTHLLTPLTLLFISSHNLTPLLISHLTSFLLLFY